MCSERLKLGGNYQFINPIALGKARIVGNFGLSECNRVKVCLIAGHVLIVLVLLLQVREAKGALDANIHFWLGKETSQVGLLLCQIELLAPMPGSSVG